MIELSPRMLEIAKLVEDSSYLLDMGTDHALLPIYLRETRPEMRILASDISKNSIEKSRKNIEDHGASGIELKVMDGLKGLDAPYPDTVIMAGMGSRLIIKVLEEAKDKLASINTFVFQPNSTIFELRSYLHGAGFKIDREIMGEDRDIFYNIILASHGEESYDKKCHYRYGKLLLEDKNPFCKSRLLEEKARFEELLQSLSASDIDSPRQEGIRKDLQTIKEALAYYEG